ncbi:DUF4214 domain-containing protein [Undibacterium sp. Di27W]
MSTYTTVLQQLYIAYFGRPADPAGLDYWENRLASKQINILDIAKSFSEQQEYKAVYLNKTTPEIINALYQNLFGHSADVAGMKYWAGQLESGAISMGQAALAIMSGPAAASMDQQALLNKVAAASVFTSRLDTADSIIAYSRAYSVDAVKSWLKNIDADAVNIFSSLNNVSNIFSGALDHKPFPSLPDFAQEMSTALTTVTGGNVLSVISAGFDTGTGKGIYNANGLFASAGSDMLTVNTSMLTGGRIDLGAGSADKLSISDSISSKSLSTIDTAGNIEILVLTGGTSGLYQVNNPGLKTIILQNPSYIEQLTANDTVVLGSAASDTIIGGAGNDTIYGGESRDVIYGGAGNDYIYTWAGDIFAGSGNDVITLRDLTVNTSRVDAGDGDDFLYSSANVEGSLFVRGGKGIDNINVFGVFSPGSGLKTVEISFADDASTPGINTAADRDTVNSWLAPGVLHVRLDADQTSAVGIAGKAQVQEILGGVNLILQKNADVAVIRFDIAGDKAVLANVLDGSALLANLGAPLLAEQSGNTGSGYIWAYDNNVAYLYAYSHATTTGLQAGDIALIGIFNDRFNTANVPLFEIS